MRKDQIFVLLLIVLLPLSGCMDGAIGDADAQDSTEGDTTVVNNYYYNNTTTSVIHPEVITFHILEGENLTLDFDGSFTYRIDTIHKAMPNGNNGVYWRANQDSVWGTQMTCDNVQIIENGYVYHETYLPVLPNQQCDFTINGNSELIIVFSNATFSQ